MTYLQHQLHQLAAYLWQHLPHYSPQLRDHSGTRRHLMPHQLFGSAPGFLDAVTEAAEGGLDGEERVGLRVLGLGLELIGSGLGDGHVL